MLLDKQLPNHWHDWGKGVGRVADTLWRLYLTSTVVLPSYRRAFTRNCVTDIIATAAQPVNGLKKSKSMCLSKPELDGPDATFGLESC